MTLDEFADRVSLCVQEKLPQDVKALVTHTTKNNGVNLTGIMFVSNDSRLRPTIYLESHYRSYKDGVELCFLADEIIDEYHRSGTQVEFDVDTFSDYEKIRDKVIFRLINRELNEEILTKIPHLPYLDLEIVFQVRLRQTLGGWASVLIHEEHLAMWGITRSGLYADAKANTEKLLPPELLPLSSILSMIPGGEECPLYVLSNEAHIGGAAVILYENVLQQCAEKVGGSYFVLPSSVDEVMILPDSTEVDPTELREMVCEINHCEVAPSDVLSDNVYYYDKDRRRLIEVPNLT